MLICMLLDYPWSELGKAKIVDVGGGVGKFQYHITYQPDLALTS